MDVNSLVSVIIPTYARPDNLLRAIESVINQSYKNIEIIVVDDNGCGSHWQIETERLLSQLIIDKKIIYVKHDINKNGSAARNTGLKNSKGEYILFLDDDDTLSHTRIERGIETLIDCPSVGAVFCDTLFSDKDVTTLFRNPNSKNMIEDLLLGKMAFNTSTMLFRKSVICELEGFDESFRRHQDYELFVRFFRNNKAVKSEHCYVTKYKTDNIVTSDPYRSIEYLEHFMNTFSDDFDSWENGGKVRSFQYSVLSRKLLNSGYQKDGLKYFMKAIKYHPLPIKTFLGLFQRLIMSYIKR